MDSILKQVEEAVIHYETKYGEKPLSILLPPVPHFELRKELARFLVVGDLTGESFFLVVGDLTSESLSVLGIPVRVVAFSAITINFEVSGRVWRDIYGCHGALAAALKA